MSTRASALDRATESLSKAMGGWPDWVAALAFRSVDVDELAAELCTAAEGWEHHDQTDDHPCSRCKRQAEVVKAHLLGGAR